MSTPLEELIEKLEKKKEQIQEIVSSIEEISIGVPPELRSKVLDSLRDQVMQALNIKIEDLIPPRTNYDKIARFLKSKGNQPQSIDQLVRGTGIKRTSLISVLYGAANRGKFLKYRTGYGKKLAWALPVKPDNEVKGGAQPVGK